MEETNNKTAEILTRVYHFSKEKTAEVLKNEKFIETLLAVASEAGVSETGCEKPTGNLIYEVATAFPEAAVKHRPFLTSLIMEKKLTGKDQLKLALSYFKNLKGAEFNEEAFKASCNLGVVITPEQIDEAIDTLMNEKAKELEERGHFLEPELFKELKLNRLKGASAKDLKDRLAAKLVAKLGPKPTGKEVKKKPAPQKEAPKEKKKSMIEEAEEAVRLQDSVKFHKPEENTQLRSELLEGHLKATGGRVVTRFPPEPNGYLHIGHAKAMNLNFGYARKHGGWCYLRYDDTNPEAETQEYIDSIESSVRWLGHEPHQITYASDRFEDLYRFAVKLIELGKGYVCSCPKTRIKEDRLFRRETGKGRPCEHRDRPIEENLKLFDDMKRGKFAEGAVTLRMKQDLDSDNPCMWDHVAYRIKYVPHPHAGDKWCIYPSYDFTHCICDSLENITHSLCSLEFDVRRESYNWLVDTLGIYRAPQLEYSRLNLTYTIMSKRKLIQLVNEHHVTGWDDPRMPTIEGVRRRGYTPEALNRFCEIVGVTRSRNVQDMGLLEECVRHDLEDSVNREMAVIHPIKVTLVNYPENKVEMRKAPNHPTKELNRGEREIPFSRVVYIDANDFRMEDSPTYYRLAPGKEVRLKYAYNIKCTEVITDATGKVVELKATVDLSNKGKPKGNIHWVAEPAPGVEPLAIELRLYDRLFKSAFPEGTKKEPKNFLHDLNPDSLIVVPKAYTNPNVKAMKVGDRIQFEREAFFIVDKDSTPEKLVFNKIVSLKEDKHKDD